MESVVEPFADAAARSAAAPEAAGGVGFTFGLAVGTVSEFNGWPLERSWALELFSAVVAPRADGCAVERASVVGIDPGTGAGVVGAIGLGVFGTLAEEGAAAPVVPAALEAPDAAEPGAETAPGADT